MGHKGGPPTSAVLGWFIQIFEAFVAAPLWAAAHAPPEGQGMAGEYGKQGYMLFLSILMKPPLMVFGFFLSFELVKIVGMMLGDGFMIFATGMQTNYATGPIAFLALTVLLAGMIVTFGHKVFGLITWLPDNVIRWVGQQAQSLGEHADEHRVRAIVAAAATQGGGVAGGAAGKLLPKDKGKGGEGKDRGGQTKTSDHDTNDVGGDGGI